MAYSNNLGKRLSPQSNEIHNLVSGQLQKKTRYLQLMSSSLSPRYGHVVQLSFDHNTDLLYGRHVVRRRRRRRRRRRAYVRAR